MQIINDITNIPDKLKHGVIAIGNFDGVHKGHQEVIKEARLIANKEKQTCTVMTFEPHPISFFKNLHNFRLTNLDEKAKLIAQLNIDALLVVNFDEKLAKMAGIAFIENILINKCAVRHIVTGYNFVFGYNRSGNAQLLQQYASEKKFNYTKITAKGKNGIIYSSTQIRNYLASGQIKTANAMLGHSYCIQGKIIKGQQLGKKLGFPTANIYFDYLHKKPLYGVYAAYIQIENDKKKYKAILNFGKKPTFTQTTEILEVHIFNFDKTIYNSTITIEFIEFIRQEKKFKNSNELQQQIKTDCKQALTILTKNKP